MGRQGGLSARHGCLAAALGVPLIHLLYSHRTEELLAALAHQLAAQRAALGSPLVPLNVVVPNAHMERLVEINVAVRTGVAANLHFLRLERFLRSVVEQHTPALPLLDHAVLHGVLLETLADATKWEDPALTPVAAWLDAGGQSAGARARRCVELTQRLAALLMEYSYSRPEMLQAWDAGRLVLQHTSSAVTETWQAALWRRARTHGSNGQPRPTLLEAVRRTPRTQTQDPAAAVHLFGISYLARGFAWALDALGRGRDVFVYTLNPCLEFWEDVPADAELRRRLRRLPKREDARQQPLGLGTDEEAWAAGADDTPALRLWGTPGRDYFRLLNQLTDGNMHGPQAVTDPGDLSVLAQLQQDIVTRHPQRTAPDTGTTPSDGSVNLLACANPRRELEVVANAIWQQVERTPALKFNDVAVLINPLEKQRYLPHLSQVFAAAQHLPHHVVDLPLVGGSPVVEAAALLLSLPASRFTRAEMLDVMLHPAVTPGPQVDRRHWVTLCARLGVFFGANRQDHAGTYVDQDVFNWDQGLRRLALGQVMTGLASGQQQPYQHASTTHLPEESREDPQGARLLLLTARALLADAMTLRSGTMPPASWGALLTRYLQAWLYAASSQQQADARRVLACVEQLAALPTHRNLDWHTVSEWMALLLADLTGRRGEYLTEGVVVSTLLPMRAVPFEHVFMVGLSEGTFPSADHRDMLDLRAAARMSGDVSPRERDLYTFLETLMCTRSALHLSWSCMDEQTGQDLRPSTVVEQVSGMMAGLGVDMNSALQTFPLDRHLDDGALDSPITEVRREAAAAQAGRQWRQALGTGDGQEAFERWAAEHPQDAAGVQQSLDLWVPPPVQAPPAAHATLYISHLRRFLECPLQGWARSVLRMRDDDDEVAAERVEDEPLAADLLQERSVLRQAFVRATGASDALERYRQQVTVMQAQGAWPVGVLHQVASRDHVDILQQWQKGLRVHAADGGPLERVRLGQDREHLEATQVLPPLRVPWSHTGPDGRVQSGTVDLVGSVEALLADATGTAHPVVRLPSGKRGRVRVLVHHLRSFVNMVVLSACDIQADQNHGSVVLCAGNTQTVEAVQLAAISRAEALALLSALVADLMAEDHAYFCPVDAVLLDALSRVPRGSTTLCSRPQPAGVHAQLCTMVHQRDAGSAAYGPVPQPTLQRIPDSRQLQRWLALRWQPFFDALLGRGP